MNKMIAERYMIISSLGEGGMADVYLAIDTILNREVAVKVLRGELSEDPVALLRFLREASAVSKLHHPNVVEVYDVGEYDKKNYIVMEYVRGRTLKQLIAQRGALQKEESVEIMKQLVSAIAHAHENNIIHRDIKPQNVLVKDDGTVKITDFGIALAHDAIQLTQSDAVLGSAHYIAPETTRGETPTVQIDIYALGIVFYELLCGSVPFKGDNPIQIAMKHLREDIPSIREFNPTLPQSIENIIIKATAKNRQYRYTSAKDMLYDLELCLLPEFENVDKIELIPDEKASGTLVLNKVQDLEKGSGTVEVKKQSSKTVDEEKAKEKKSKDTTMKKIVFAIAAILLLGAITAGVYFSGIIESFSPVKMVVVPDITNLTMEEAKEELESYGLVLKTKHETEVTDDVEEGLIIRYSPEGKVAEGSRIEVTVSSGMYYVVPNFKGEKLDNVLPKLPNYISVIKEYEPSIDIEVGTILEQSIEAGDKLTPGISKQIKFVVASSPEFEMDDYVGSKIETAKSNLEKFGAKVKLEQLPTEDMDEEELEAIEKGVVIKQTPEAGTYYIQEGNSVVTLYYY